MANFEPDVPWRNNNNNNAESSEKSKHCRKKRKAKVLYDHDHNNNNNEFKAPKHSKNNTNVGAEKAESKTDSHACSECGKKFWSWKALFGHMRCHPEREWRGINPPANFRRNQTDKQSAKDYDAAESLLLLKSGTHDRRVSETNFAVLCKCNRFECSNCNSRVSHKTDNVDSEGHKCSICQRSFSSGQALGGHKRRHWEKSENLTISIASTPQVVQLKQECGCGVDLNLPPPLPLPLSLQHASPPTLDLRLGL